MYRSAVGLPTGLARRPPGAPAFFSRRSRSPEPPRSCRPAAAGSRPGKSIAAHTLPLPRRLRAVRTPATHGMHRFCSFEGHGSRRPKSTCGIAVLDFRSRRASTFVRGYSRSRELRWTHRSLGEGASARSHGRCRPGRPRRCISGRTVSAAATRARAAGRDAPTVRVGSHRGDPASRDPCRWNDPCRCMPRVAQAQASR